MKKGWDAIRAAEKDPARWVLCHHNTPLEDAAKDIGVELAEEIAREDDRLVYAVERDLDYFDE